MGLRTETLIGFAMVLVFLAAECSQSEAVPTSSSHITLDINASLKRIHNLEDNESQGRRDQVEAKTRLWPGQSNQPLDYANIDQDDEDYDEDADFNQIPLDEYHRTSRAKTITESREITTALTTDEDQTSKRVTSILGLEVTLTTTTMKPMLVATSNPTTAATSRDTLEIQIVTSDVPYPDLMKQYILHPKQTESIKWRHIHPTAKILVILMSIMSFGLLVAISICIWPTTVSDVQHSVPMTPLSAITTDPLPWRDQSP